MKALVIGATGLVGNALVNQLNDNPAIEKIVTFSRRPFDLKSEKVEQKVIDFEDLDDYREHFTGDVLFSCLGTTKKSAGNLGRQRRVDVDYQIHVAQLARWNGVPNYLLVSSAGAHSASVSPYLRMKGDLEESVRGLGFTSTYILQPSLLLGKREKFRAMESLGKVAMAPLGVLPLLRRYRPIPAAVVARKMVSIATNNPRGFHLLKLDALFSVSDTS